MASAAAAVAALHRSQREMVTAGLADRAVALAAPTAHRVAQEFRGRATPEETTAAAVMAVVVAERDRQGLTVRHLVTRQAGPACQ